jgi:hypothetical protein
MKVAGTFASRPSRPGGRLRTGRSALLQNGCTGTKSYLPAASAFIFFPSDPVYHPAFTS